MKMEIIFTMMFVMVLFNGAWGASESSDWCVAKPASGEVELNDAIAYVCKETGVDCSPIRQNGKCFNPQTLYNHASFVMNRFYQSRGHYPSNCKFGGIGMFASSDPSYGPCVYDHA